jgi:hypothetical protein
LLAERYERGSVLLTSNLPFSKWDGIFKDPMTTAAAIDRLVHHCVIVELNIPNYRMEQAKKNRDTASDGIVDAEYIPPEFQNCLLESNQSAKISPKQLKALVQNCRRQGESSKIVC